MPDANTLANEALIFPLFSVFFFINNVILPLLCIFKEKDIHIFKEKYQYKLQ